MPLIARIETFLVPPRWLFVRIETDDGLVGWGEASLEGHGEAVAGAFESVRDRLIGRLRDGGRIVIAVRGASLRSRRLARIHT